MDNKPTQHIPGSTGRNDLQNMSAPIRSINRLARLTRIAISLNAERDYGRLLEMILQGARELTGADGGTLYILGPKNQLNFALMETQSLGLSARQGGPGPVPEPIPLYDPDGTPNTRLMATRAIFENRIINIPDTYTSRQYNFSGTHAFDRSSGYRSRSMLTLPLKDHRDQIIGALQLINALHSRTGDIIPFSRGHEHLAMAFASLAGTILTQKKLVDGLEELLQGLIRLVATAIDQKSPYTGGHCRRVSELTLMLAETLNDNPGPGLETPALGADDLYELEMAAWLHDCGKISTPEHIIDKRSKLESIFDRIHHVRAKLEILHRDAEIEYLRSRMEALERGDSGGLEKTEERWKARRGQIAEACELLTRWNQGDHFMPEQDRQRIRELGAIEIRYACDGTSAPLLGEDEIKNLCIPKGTLTEDERQRINHHILVTRNMLETLPFPEHLKNVPQIAGAHHERMDGKGYPDGLSAEQLPLQTRILAIADIFEALTASDRPYRKAKPLSEALLILDQMAAEGHIDPELCALFQKQKVYLKYAHRHMNPSQIDME